MIENHAFRPQGGISASLPSGGGPISRRNALRLGAGGGLAATLSAMVTQKSTAASAPADNWKRYPFALFGADPRFMFPSAEGVKDDHGTDTWYVDGLLRGSSGRQYAFIVIFCKNRIASLLRADFYTFALFDLKTGDYGTYTQYDFPPGNLLSSGRFSGSQDHLDLAFSTSEGTARWVTRTDAQGRLVPFGYQLKLVGKDQKKRSMSLVTTMDPANPPTAVGTGRGIIECFGQPDTGTYFQTAPHFQGTLTWGGLTETVTGRMGHIDRQWFPGSAFSEVGFTARGISHEWRSINLDDGTDLSLWRQFDRDRRNQLIPYTGSTRFIPGRPGTPGRTEHTADLDITYTSFVKWPSTVGTFVPPVSPNRYAPSAHRVRIAAWDLDLVATPITPIPAHNLPVEYMIGPVRYEGTLAGKPISGFGVSERTLSLYRDWELIEVLRTTVTNLPDRSLPASGLSRASLLVMVDELDDLVSAGRRLGLVLRITRTVKPAVSRLADPDRTFLLTLLGDLALASST